MLPKCDQSLCRTLPDVILSAECHRLSASFRKYQCGAKWHVWEFFSPFLPACKNAVPSGGLGAHLTRQRKLTKPAPSSLPASQCQLSTKFQFVWPVVRCGIHMCSYIEKMGCISLGDIHNLPTFWVLALFGTFYNFCFCVQTCRHLGGGMCILFEMCKKTPFQKCMGLGGRA
jgi:hypothetical protein